MGQPQSRTEIFERRRRREEHTDDPLESSRGKRQRTTIQSVVPNDNNTRSIIVIDDDQETSIRGDGTQDLPFTFREWTTGDVILRSEAGKTFEIFEHNENDNITVSDEDSFVPEESASLRQTVGEFAAGLRQLEGTSEVDDDSGYDDSSPIRPPLLPRQASRREGLNEDNGSEVSLDARTHDSRSSTMIMSSLNPSHLHSAESRIPIDPLWQTLHADWPVHEEDYEGEDNDPDCYIAIDGADEDDDEALARISRQIPYWRDWEEDEHIKKEPANDVPSLTLSQESTNAEYVDTLDHSQSTVSSSALLIEPSPSQLEQLEEILPTLKSPKQVPAPRKTLTEKQRLYQERREMTKFKKRLFYTTLASSTRVKLEQLTQRFIGDLAMSKDEDECWIYEGHDSCQTRNNISVKVKFWHEGQQYALCINLGFIQMLLKHLLTPEAKEGIIEDWWHASHLCGNWRCVNVKHIYPEPGPINCSRNSCFHGSLDLCPHDPPCRKHLTIRRERITKDIGKDNRKGATIGGFSHDYYRENLLG
jgi:hypothetical protein